MLTDAILSCALSSGQTARSMWGGRVVRWCLVNFQCRCVLLIWIKLGQGPTALVGAGAVVWIFFLPSILSISSLEEGMI